MLHLKSCKSRRAINSSTIKGSIVSWFEYSKFSIYLFCSRSSNVNLLFEQEIENPANYEGTDEQKLKAASEADISLKKAGINYFIKEFPFLKSQLSEVENKFSVVYDGWDSDIISN